MSWFTLQDIPRDKWVGTWLRCNRSAVNSDLAAAARETKCYRFFDAPEWIEIVDVLPGDFVQLEVRCVNIFDCIRNKRRRNVFTLTLPANPDWVCEGDLGRWRDVKLVTDGNEWDNELELAITATAEHGTESSSARFRCFLGAPATDNMRVLNNENA